MNRSFTPVLFLVAVSLAGCADRQADEGAPEAAAAEPSNPEDQREGVYQYIGTLKGQSWLGDGSFVFLYGPSDNSTQMIGEAGTYTTANDTFIHTITHSTDPSRVGVVFKWTTVSMAGDTSTYVVMDEANTITGHGQSVKVD